MSAHGNVDLGHTLAGWTGTALGTLAAAVAGASLCFAWAAGLWTGGALAVLALLVTWGLHLAGWGKPSGPRASSQWPWRVKDAGAGAGHAHCVGCLTAGRTAPVPALGPALGPGERAGGGDARAVGSGS